MTIEDLQTLFAEHPELAAVRRELKRGRDTHILLSGLHASARALVLSRLAQPLFIVLDTEEAARYLYGDLKSIMEHRPAAPDRVQSTDSIANVFFFPHSQKRRTVDEAARVQRTETLSALAEYRPASPDRIRNTDRFTIIVTYPEAIAEAVPRQEELSAISFQVRTGQEIQQSILGERLTELGFERVDFVFEPGQFAIRGGIVDIYSYSHDLPYRLDFFGDEIESIREFDIEDQLSKARTDFAEIVGSSNDGMSALGASSMSAAKPLNDASIVDYLPEETVWVSNDWSVVKFKLDGLGVLGGLGTLEEN